MFTWVDAEIQGFKNYPSATILDLQLRADAKKLSALCFFLLRLADDGLEIKVYAMQFNQALQQLRLYIPWLDEGVIEKLSSTTFVKLSEPVFFGSAFSRRNDGINIVVCDEVGMGSAIFLAEYFKTNKLTKNTYLFFATNEKFSFTPIPSQFITSFLPGHVIASMPLMEDWGILCRLLSPGLPGCFDESIDFLLSMMVEHVSQQQEQDIYIELMGVSEFVEKIQFQADSSRVSLMKTSLARYQY